MKQLNNSGLNGENGSICFFIQWHLEPFCFHPIELVHKHNGLETNCVICNYFNKRSGGKKPTLMLRVELRNTYTRCLEYCYTRL